MGGTLEPMSAEPPELGRTPSGPDFAPPPDGGSAEGIGPWAYGSSGPDPHGSDPYGPLGYGPGFSASGGPGGGRGFGPSDRAFPARPAVPPQSNRYAAPRSRWPLLITVAVIVVVAVIAVVGTVRGGNDLRPEPAGSGATPTPSAAPTDPANSITFSSHEGSGRLTVLSHRWSSDASAIPRHGGFLQLQVRISVTDGHVSYGPQFFQSFDAASNLFETDPRGARPPVLSNGVLGPGQSVTGGIAFDMPRGDVTLLMTNSLLESVTALRITA